MTRAQLVRLTDERIAEARALLAAGLWSGAYYVVGYAVEFALKVCIHDFATQTGAIFQDRKFSEKCWTHDATALLRIADLEVAFKAELASRPPLYDSWAIVEKWTEASRYSEWSEANARAMVAAVSDSTDGVVSWIKNRW